VAIKGTLRHKLIAITAIGSCFPRGRKKARHDCAEASKRSNLGRDRDILSTIVDQPAVKLVSQVLGIEKKALPKGLNELVRK